MVFVLLPQGPSGTRVHIYHIQIMSSLPVRDQKTDRLLTPENAVLVLIDFQPSQINSVNSMNRAELLRNVVFLGRIARIFKLPVILSTVNVGGGHSKDTVPVLRRALGNIPSYDRTSINAWEDMEFYEAVKGADRSKLIMAALWTEACLTFPALDALAEGYEVYPVADAVGGTSVTAHQAALRRMQQAGARLTSVAQVACELQRDWNREQTVPELVGLFQEAGIFLNLGK